ncbi:MAG: hypothetical protein AB8B85_06065 [Paracoccaceae bacterium]
MHYGPIQATLARREMVGFSIPHFIDGIGAALRRDSEQYVAGLKRQSIGAPAAQNWSNLPTVWAGQQA